MNTSVLTAVFKRNFFSYFANPTGYVFICVFVFLSAIAAFWPDEFFNANLANLDQLNKFFPFIMLFFVPAITMSIWADETRQGTDELLLTIPATDVDIVLGKYLAALAIYTVSLLISAASNLAVLSMLGNPDWGLYLCTHVGYWFLGLAMLAVGMVASFLTRNLTVAYILGALFNAPLVLMARVDIIPALNHKFAATVRHWSLGGQCLEFGRGILGLSGMIYFVCIAAIMLYVCMVLIGRRNWARGGNTTVQSGHYLVRGLSLAATAVALVFFVQNHDARSDATSEQLSSLSPYTIELVKSLKTDYDKATKLQPQIARLEEVVTKQEDARKKKEEAEKKAAAATSKTSAAKPADAKSSAAPAKADEKKPSFNPEPAATGKADDKKPNEKKPDDAKSSAAPTKAGEKKASFNPEPAATGKADDKKADDKKANEKKPETKAVDTPAVPLTDEAKKLAELKKEFDALQVHGPVRIDAFISAEVPESYVQTRINLLNVLREFKAMAGDMVELEMNDEMQRTGALAEVARNRFNIEPQLVGETQNGAYKKDNIFMGVAFTSGLEKVVVPFVYRGMSAEYELVRSLCTVTRQKRMRVGVLETDAHVTGSFSQMGPTRAWQLIDELKKQYEVVTVSPQELAAPPKPGESEKRYDVLLAIQPSAMGPQEMDGFISTIRRGQPTVIFEDPFFLMMGGVPGTYQPRQPQGMMGGYAPEQREKGDIRALWRLLGIDFADGGEGDEFNPMPGGPPPRETGRVVWQRYNPFPKFGDLPPELVFIDHGCGAKDPFCDDDPKTADAISSKLQHLFFPGPGFIEDTPQVVKRLIAKWHNRQYAKQLRKQVDDLAKKLDDAESQGSEEGFIELANKWADVQQELSRVSSGGEGVKTIRPDQIGDDDTLRKLVKDVVETTGTYPVSELRRDLQNRFPIRLSGEGISEDESTRLVDEEPDQLRKEATKLSGEAARLVETLADLKQSLRSAVTVDDVIKYAEGVIGLQIKDRKFKALVQTASKSAGTIPVGRIFDPMEGFGRREELSPSRSLYYQPSESQQYVLAAHIQGAPRGGAKGAAPINVVLAADAEMVSDIFFRWREQGGLPDQDIVFDFDNITFALNALDSVAGDSRFLEIRKRRPQHRVLERFDAKTRAAREESARAGEQQRKEHDDNIKNAIKQAEAKKKQIFLEAKKRGLGMVEIAQLLANEEKNLARKQQEQEKENHEKYAEEIRKINDAQDATILGMQATYKLWAVIIPPIPPLLVAAFVFFNRRAKEREGVSSKRLR